MAAGLAESPREDSPHIRVYTDGCYDLVHYGHANSLRQAKKLGTYLVSGAHSEEQIAFHKGPPLSKEVERFDQLRAIRWVDEVMERSPYQITPKVLDQIKCDFTVHGNDISPLAGGADCYSIVKDAKRYREVERTEGVSTTDLVDRLLRDSKTHHLPAPEGEMDITSWKWVPELCTDSNAIDPCVEVFYFLSSGIKRVISGVGPKPGQKICYTYGSFDLFHHGHVQFLKKAQQMDQYVIVGLLDDQIVNSYKGGSYPILSLVERLRSVVACRYVNAVVVYVPYKLNEEILDFFKPDVVVHGVNLSQDFLGKDPYRLAKDRGLLSIISSGSTLTSSKLMARIVENRVAFVERNQRQVKKTDVK